MGSFVFFGFLFVDRNSLTKKVVPFHYGVSEDNTKNGTYTGMLDNNNLIGNPCQLQSGELLNDVSASGRNRPWVKHKLQSLGVADAYGFFEQLKKYAQRVSDCGSWLRFSSCQNGHYKRLLSASFCKCRLCVMCQWRKSLVIYHQVFKLIHEHRKSYSSDIPLLLTLTIPNPKSDELRKSLDDMQVAFKKLVDRRSFERAIRSWFKALEVTYNEEKNTYHPHFHVLLLVPKAYFDHGRGLYISQEQWLEMWRESTGIKEITQVDIRKVKKRSKHESVESISAEVSKYATKPSSYLKQTADGNFNAPPKVIKTLHYALRNRRLVGYGGLFAKLRKKLKLEDIEKASLINISEDEQVCTCPVCQSTLREELYSWNLGARGYIG